MSRRANLLLSLAGLAALSSLSALSVPKLISYQGQLNNQSGSPVNATVNFIFSLYGAPTGGTPVWTEPQTVSVSNGVFNVQLGAIQDLPASIFAQDVLYLGIRAGADSEMIPRQRITTSAYSQRAETVSTTIINVPVGGVVAWNKSMTNTPALPVGWTECNGGLIADPESPYNGQTAPNLNGVADSPRFLRGSTASGATGGSETHSHGLASGNCGSGGPSCNRNAATNLASSLPSYYEVVWIMRVK